MRMFPIANYVVCILVIVLFPLSDFTQQTCYQDSPPPTPSFLQDVDVPPFDQQKYIADQDREPFHILFILMNSVSNEMSEVIEDATRKVNQRLASILKAPRLEEIRRVRIWNKYQRCDPPTCGWYQSFIPGEYAMPCRSPSGGIIFEHKVPCSVSKKVQQLNRERTVSLVVYLTAERANPKHVDYCANKDLQSQAYSSWCQRASSSTRPTHGHIGVCVGASELHGDKAERVILHEVLHILTHSNIVGMGSPKLGCPYDGNSVRSKLQCEGKTYKAVQQLWQQADGTVITRTRLLMITPSVVEAARRHFECPTLEGAEIVGVEVTKEQSEELGGTVKAGTLLPQSHWSPTLFIDEILMPNDCGHMRLSGLTLGLLRDLDWYDVDMDAAEEMVSTKPEPGEGCRIAETNYSEIVVMARSAQATKKQQVPHAVVTGNMGPYCDFDYGDKHRVITSLCHNDQEPQDCIKSKNPFCGVLARPDIYDSFACDRSRLIARTYNPVYGASVGPGTTCLTFLPVRRGRFYTGAIGLCVEYYCSFDMKEVVLIWKPKGMECMIRCPESASKKVWIAVFAEADDCSRIVGKTVKVICPNYGTVCQQDSAIDPDKIVTSEAVILTSEWMGVGSVLAATVTIGVTGYLLIN